MIEQSSAEFREFYGWAELSPPDPVVAGSYGTWSLRYHVGTCGIDDRGRIRVAQRSVCDWGQPQTADPCAPNYMSVSTTARARVQARYEPNGNVRPWARTIVLDVLDGFLAEGDTVTLVLGDKSEGSPGSMAQTFCEPRSEFKVLVDPFGTGVFIELDSSTILEITSGPASELECILPSDVAVGERFRASLRVIDRWGNPADTYDGTIELADGGLKGVPSRVSFTQAGGGILHIDDLWATAAGIYRLVAKVVGSDLRASSNALTVSDKMPTYRRFWGDLHGQSSETVGVKTIDDYLAFARDKALVDFCGHQGNCFQITQEVWRCIREAIKRYHEPGRFITFLGYEWSGLTPNGGDRNVYFLGDDGPLHRAGHWLIPDRSDADSDCYPVSKLYERLSGRRDVLITPHVGGRYADLRFHDPSLEPLVEIYSAWGEFEWLLAEALERGYRVGVVCGSDEHKGKPGASRPGNATFGVRGGLLCVLASELTREALWEALWARRCYGTTGERIALEFEAAGTPMGGELETSVAPVFRVRVAGTQEIERIELRRGMECIATFPKPQDIVRSPCDVRIQWRGARNKGRERAARWDGSIECAGTSIIGARPYAFDSPAEKLTEVNAHRIAWRSVTTGDSDGVILTLDPANRGVLRFTTSIASFEIDLQELQQEPRVYNAGGLGLQVIVERLPRGVSHDVAMDLCDSVLPDGITPYHIMALQVNGAKAWSSPIWIKPSPT
jgi:hypothetical protein